MPTIDAILGVVDTWFVERIACGPIAQHTPAYNQALAAKGELKTRVAALFEPPASPKLDTTKPTADAAAQPSSKE